MDEALLGLASLALMLMAAWFGLWLQPRLAEHHRSRETTDTVRLMITMLLTFASLVLSLLLISVKNSYDTANDDLRAYAASLIQMEHELIEYGPETAAAQRLYRRYVAGMIESTWPDEPPPRGAPAVSAGPAVKGQPMESTALGTTLYQLETAILALDPTTPQQHVLAPDLLAHWHDVLAHRWRLIDVAHATISAPFMVVMMIWLMLIYGSFGLTMPRNEVSFVILGLSAVSIALAIFFILDIDTPFSGYITIPSAPMREALALAYGR